MAHVLFTKRLAGSPLAIGGGEHLIAVDSHSVVSKIHLEKKSIIGRWIISRVPKANHPFSKNCHVSPLGDICYAAAESHVAEIYETSQTLLHAHTLSWHKKPIEVVKYSPNGAFLATGGMDGRTLLYDVKMNYYLESALDPLGDFISALEFSENSLCVGICSFSRKNVFFDIEQSKVISTFRTPSVVESIVFIKNGARALCLLRDGKVLEVAVRTGKCVMWSVSLDVWPTVSVVSEDGGFVICGSKGSQAVILNARSKSVVCRVTLPHDCGVSSLMIREGKLLVGFVTEGVVMIDMEYRKNDFDTFLKLKNFEEVIELIELNPYLLIRKDFEEILTGCWSEILDEAMKLLADDKIAEAQKKVALFIGDPKRATIFKELLEQKETVASFLKAVEIGDFQAASSLAQMHPFLRETIAFDTLKFAWNKTFTHVKKLLQEDYHGHHQFVKGMLEPFMVFQEFQRVGEALVSNISKFKEADQCLKGRNFRAYFELCSKYEFLQESQTYQKTLALGVSLHERLLTFELEEKFDEIKEGLAILKAFPTMGENVTRLEEIVKAKLSFIAAAEKNDIVTAYTLVLSHPTIIELRQYASLHQSILKNFTEAKECASIGDVTTTLRIVNPYLQVDFWRKKGLSILKTGYLIEIEQSEKDLYDKTESLRAFLICFGVDSEVETRCAEGELAEPYTKLTRSVLPEPLPPSTYPPTFLVKHQ